MPRQFITALILLGVFIFTIFAYATGSHLFLALGILVPAVLVFGTRSDLVFVSVIALSLSRLTIPGMPVDLYLYQIMMLLFVVMTMARLIISKEQYPKPPGYLWARMFMGAVLLVVLFRGVGFRMFGGAKAGGAIYIQILLTMLFYFLSATASVRKKQVKIAVVLMALFTFVPFFLQLIVILSRGVIWQPLLFLRMQAGLAETFQGYGAGSETTRWTIFASLSSLYLVPAVVWSFRGKRIFWYALFFGLSLMVSILSGYRHTVLVVGTFIVLFLMVQTRRPVLVLVLLFFAGVGVLLILIPNMERLPFAMQRVLSMIPGVRVSSIASIQASQTVEWRRLLWRLAWADIGRYLLIGKGYAYDYGAFIAMSLTQFSEADQVRAYLLTGDLHQGTLDLLYNLGIPGFACFLGWVIKELAWNIRRQAQAWQDSEMRRYHLVFLLLLTVNALQAFLAGIARDFLVTLPFQMAILHAIVVSEAAASKPLAGQTQSAAQPGMNA